MADPKKESQDVQDVSCASINRTFSHKIDDFNDIEKNNEKMLNEIEAARQGCSKKVNSGENGESKIDHEDLARVKEFLERSLNIDEALSSHSTDNNQVGSGSSNSSSSNASSCGEEDAQCKICNKIFLDQYDLDVHIRSRKLKDKRYMCCNCQKIFRDNTQLKVHGRKHTGEKPFECKICHKKFTVNGNLNKHMRIHTGDRRYECTDCGRKFTQFAHLEDHLKTHSGERPFICGYCQASFKTKGRLKKHERSHTSSVRTKRSVSCPKCDIILNSNRQLGAHLMTHVQNSDGPFICHMCGKAFLKFKNLQDHQGSHTEAKSFFCEFCDRKFASGTHLRRHMNSHSGFRPYSCSICNRPFPSPQNLKRHIMTHTGERPFDCSDCGRKFLTLENMNRHKRTHTGEKPYSCEICGRLFAHSTTAKEHYRTMHTSETPYHCSWCPQKFSISKSLFKHVRVRHPDYFPEFKKEKDLTPNMRKAMNKFKRGIKCEDSNVKVDFHTDNVFGKPLITEEKTKTEPIFKIKEEPVDTSEQISIETGVPFSVTCSDIEDKKSQNLVEMTFKDETGNAAFEIEHLDIPLIKSEKFEMEE